MEDRCHRRADDLANIISLDHLNLQIPDQGIATVFYVVGLGFTRDPYMMVGVDNMWVNLGRQQFHLLTRSPQVVNGRTGLVVEDLTALQRRLEFVSPRLAQTSFSWRYHSGIVEVRCPWGNLFRCHAPSEEFGRMTLGIPYIEFDVLPGSARGICRFYREVIGAWASVVDSGEGEVAVVSAGTDQELRFRETHEPIAPYDGYHVQLTLADFSGTQRRLDERGLVTEISNAHQYRFVRVIDLESGHLLAEVEHELRSVLHPMYARPLINRNPAQSVGSYALGADSWRPAAPPIRLGSRKTVAPPS